MLALADYQECRGKRKEATGQHLQGTGARTKKVCRTSSAEVGMPLSEMSWRRSATGVVTSKSPSWLQSAIIQVANGQQKQLPLQRSICVVSLSWQCMPDETVGRSINFGSTMYSVRNKQMYTDILTYDQQARVNHSVRSAEQSCWACTEDICAHQSLVVLLAPACSSWSSKGCS